MKDHVDITAAEEDQDLMKEEDVDLDLPLNIALLEEVRNPRVIKKEAIAEVAVRKALTARKKNINVTVLANRAPNHDLVQNQNNQSQNQFLSQNLNLNQVPNQKIVNRNLVVNKSRV